MIANFLNAARRLFLYVLLFSLSACGAGGIPGFNDDAYTVSPTSISFTAAQNSGTPPSQQAGVRVNSGTVYIRVDYSGSAIANASFEVTGSTTGVITISPVSSNRSPGTYTGTVTVYGCGDQYCNSSVSGSPKTINVTYVVHSDFAVSPASLNFSYISGGAPPSAQNISATGTSATGWTASVSQPWITLGSTTGTTPSTVSVAVNPSGLSVGTHSATITFSSGIGISRTVSVSLTVSPQAISVSPQVLTYNYQRSGVAPSAQAVTVSGTIGLNWTAVADQGWVNLSSASGTTPSTINVGVDPAGMGVGTYSSVVTFTSGALSASITVWLTVADPQLNVTPASLTFNGIAGASITGQLLNLSVSSGATDTWSATAGASWVVLGRSTGTTPDSLPVGIDTTGLATGTHTTTISISGNGYWASRTVSVTLNLLSPTLTVTPASLMYGGASGHDMSDKTLSLSLNTGTRAHSWSILSASNWLQVIPTNGTVSATSVNVTVRADAATLPVGTTDGTIVIAAQVEGTAITRSISVQAILDDHRLIASDVGVALTSTPTLSKLTRTLNVRSNRSATVNWSAASDQAWLAVTPSGTTQDDLELAADPTGLAVDTLHYATVSVTSDEPTITNSETIRVGLWVGSTTPGVTTTITSAFGKVVTDPVRPYAYVHSGGTDITVYNLYTGTVATTISSVAPLLSNMAIARDGSRLFAVDATNYTIVPVELPAFTVGSPWAIGSSVPAYLAFARPNGVNMLFSGNGRIFNPSSGSAYSPTFSGGYYGNAVVTASLQGNRFCTLNYGLSPYTVTCHALDYSTFNAQPILGVGKSGSSGSNGRDLALNSDGSRVYVASGSPYSFVTYDAAATSPGMAVVQYLTANAYPNAVEVGTDNKIYGGASVWYGPRDVWIYNSAGVLLSDYYVSGYAQSLVDRGLAVSGDGLRMVTITDDPSLKFTTVGP